VRVVCVRVRCIVTHIQNIHRASPHILRAIAMYECDACVQLPNPPLPTEHTHRRQTFPRTPAQRRRHHMRKLHRHRPFQTQTLPVQQTTPPHATFFVANAPARIHPQREAHIDTPPHYQSRSQSTGAGRRRYQSHAPPCGAQPLAPRPVSAVSAVASPLPLGPPRMRRWRPCYAGSFAINCQLHLRGRGEVPGSVGVEKFRGRSGRRTDGPFTLAPRFFLPLPLFPFFPFSFSSSLSSRPAVLEKFPGTSRIFSF